MDFPSLFVSVFILVSSACVFLSAFILCKLYIKSTFVRFLDDKDASSISMRIVSGLQGACCTLAGLIIINSVNDLLHERHWLTETYVLIGTGYLIYDTWATFICFSLNHKDLTELPLVSRLVTFVRNDPAMMFHHIGLPVLYLPTIMYFRNGLGDGIIGCFMLIEATVPFISFHEILVILRLQKSWLYVCNGLFTVIVYTASRIALFPWMFWIYGRQMDASWIQVAFLLPRSYILGCGVFLGLYLYWWVVILRVAHRELKERFNHAPTKDSSIVNCHKKD